MSGAASIKLKDKPDGERPLALDLRIC